MSNKAINALENWFKTNFSESFIRENFELIQKDRNIEHKQFNGSVVVTNATFANIASPWETLNTSITLHFTIKGIETFIIFSVGKIDSENENLMYILLKKSEEEKLFLTCKVVEDLIRKTKFSDEVLCMNLSGMPEHFKGMKIGQAKAELAKIKEKLAENAIAIITS